MWAGVARRSRVEVLVFMYSLVATEHVTDYFGKSTVRGNALQSIDVSKVTR
jgi:hypothetical protein